MMFLLLQHCIDLHLYLLINHSPSNLMKEKIQLIVNTEVRQFLSAQQAETTVVDMMFSRMNKIISSSQKNKETFQMYVNKSINQWRVQGMINWDRKYHTEPLRN